MVLGQHETIYCKGDQLFIVHILCTDNFQLSTNNSYFPQMAKMCPTSSFLPFIPSQESCPSLFLTGIRQQTPVSLLQHSSLQNFHIIKISVESTMTCWVSAGLSRAQSSMSGGNRASSSTSYLADANERPNLTVLINAMVTKLLPTDSSAAVKSFLNVQFSDARTMLGNCSVILSVLFMLRCTVTPQPPLHFKYRQTKRSSYLLDPQERLRSSNFPVQAHLMILHLWTYLFL